MLPRNNYPTVYLTIFLQVTDLIESAHAKCTSAETQGRLIVPIYIAMHCTTVGSETSTIGDTRLAKPILSLRSLIMEVRGGFMLAHLRSRQHVGLL